MSKPSPIAPRGENPPVRSAQTPGYSLPCPQHHPRKYRDCDCEPPKPPQKPTRQDTCRWCLTLSYAKCGISEHWALIKKEYETADARWREMWATPAQPTGEVQPNGGSQKPVPVAQASPVSTKGARPAAPPEASVNGKASLADCQVGLDKLFAFFDETTSADGVQKEYDPMTVAAARNLHQSNLAEFRKLTKPNDPQNDTLNACAFFAA